MAHMAGCSDEPWFLRFRRMLVHHHKSALSNPAQFLRILTGQEALHHPFTLVSNKPRKAEVNRKAPESQRVERIRERVKEEREERAAEKIAGAEGIFAALPLLQRCEDPVSADRLLLDTLLGTGRIVDDLRSLSNLARTPITSQMRLEALQQAIINLSSAITGMRPLKVSLSAEDVTSLCAHLKCFEDVPQAVRRWSRVLKDSHRDAHGRPLYSLESSCNHLTRANFLAMELRSFLHQLESTGPWLATLGTRTPKAYSAAALKTLATRLLLVCDLARGSDACSSAFRAPLMEAQSVACQILREILGQSGQASDRLISLQLQFMGDQLQLAPRKSDSRVPWPPDHWQRDLLNAIDENTGVLVSAPTSAGKTFAAYYAMERVLRVSNTGAVLFVAPTEALAAQVEAEVYARFSQKTYPHDGYALCARWGRELATIAQIVVALAEKTEELLADNVLWARLNWVICDEIHMQPLPGLKALAQRCGQAAVPFLAMSATVQNPKRMRERLAVATRCPDFKLIIHSERIVDLQLYCWQAAEDKLHSLHPWLLLNSETVKHAPLPQLAPSDALLVWQSLPAVAPALSAEASELQAEVFLEKRRLGPLAKTLPLFLCIRAVRYALAEFLNKPVLMLREEFRAWERNLAKSVQSLDDASVARLLSILDKNDIQSRSIEQPVGAAGEFGPLYLSRLLQDLKRSDLLPCLCFHKSAERIEILLLGLSQVLNRGAKQLLEETAEERSQIFAQQKAAWHLQHQTLSEQLQETRTRVRGALSNQAEVAKEEWLQQRTSELQVARQHCAKQAQIQKFAQLTELMPLLETNEQETCELVVQTFHKAHGTEILRDCFAAWSEPTVDGASRRSDMWGHEGDGDEAPKRPRKVKDVEGDPRVRAARAALEAHEESGQPVLQQDTMFSDYSFEALRPQHVYKTEIQLLLEHAEKELRTLGSRRGNMLWAQSMIFALHRGVAMHFSEERAEDLNFTVQLLFRIGHVRVLLADEALSCGMNLPCRTVVILDSTIRGAVLTQMAGRAGRRGLDLFGATVYVHDLETIRCMHAE